MITFIHLGSSLRIHGVLRALLFKCHGVLRKGNSTSTFLLYLSFDSFVLVSTFTYSLILSRPTALHYIVTNHLVVQQNAVWRNTIFFQFLPLS